MRPSQRDERAKWLIKVNQWNERLERRTISHEWWLQKIDWVNLKGKQGIGWAEWFSIDATEKPSEGKRRTLEGFGQNAQGERDARKAALKADRWGGKLIWRWEAKIRNINWWPEKCQWKAPSINWWLGSSKWLAGNLITLNSMQIWLAYAH